MGFSRQEYWSGVPSPSLNQSHAKAKSKLDLKSSLFSQSGLAAAGTTIAGNGGMDHCFPFSRLPSPVCELTSDLSRAKVGSEKRRVRGAGETSWTVLWCDGSLAARSSSQRAGVCRVARGSRASRLVSCSTRVQLACSVRDLSSLTGDRPVSPASKDVFLTPGPPGKTLS